jgi:hypothetical protein
MGVSLLRFGHSIYYSEQFGSGIPIADGHILIDRECGDAGKAALRGFGDEPGEIQNVLSGKRLIDAFLSAHEFLRFACGKRSSQKKEMTRGDL